MITGDDGLVLGIEKSTSFAGGEAKRATLPETNIAPENRPLERIFLLETTNFRGYVRFRECNTCLWYTNVL